MRSPPRTVWFIATLAITACDLPSTGGDRGSFAVCPFGPCQGRTAGSPDGSDSGRTDGADGADGGSGGDSGWLGRSDFVDAFASSWCRERTDCDCEELDCSGSEYEERYADCADDVASGAGSCDDFRSAWTDDCIDAVDDIDSCGDVWEGGWDSPCREVFPDCGSWWNGARR